MMRLDDELRDCQIITVHPMGSMNVCVSNPSCSSSNISLKTKNVNLMVAPEEKSGHHQS